jgi:tRNA threonylcarbamoyladenosine modification (KEOPS) complex Cgi121 subunit
LQHKLILIQGLELTSLPDLQQVIKTLNRIEQRYGVTIQTCDASRIATWEHIFFGALYAILAFKQNRTISNQLSLETLLYISAQRQIKVALAEFGIRVGNSALMILGDSEEILMQALEECQTLLAGTPSDEVLTIANETKWAAIQDYFQISECEIDAIALSGAKESREEALFKLVLNRVALVTCEK